MEKTLENTRPTDPSKRNELSITFMFRNGRYHVLELNKGDSPEKVVFNLRLLAAHIQNDRHFSAE